MSIGVNVLQQILSVIMLEQVSCLNWYTLMPRELSLRIFEAKHDHYRVTHITSGFWQSVTAIHLQNAVLNDAVFWHNLWLLWRNMFTLTRLNTMCWHSNPSVLSFFFLLFIHLLKKKPGWCRFILVFAFNATHFSLYVLGGFVDFYHMFSSWMQCNGSC